LCCILLRPSFSLRDVLTAFLLSFQSVWMSTSCNTWNPLLSVIMKELFVC
jgi:hypothetical protein